jgi:hypothetical protein
VWGIWGDEQMQRYSSFLIYVLQIISSRAEQLCKAEIVDPADLKESYSIFNRVGSIMQFSVDGTILRSVTCQKTQFIT